MIAFPVGNILLFVSLAQSFFSIYFSGNVWADNTLNGKKHFSATYDHGTLRPLSKQWKPFSCSVNPFPSSGNLSPGSGSLFHNSGNPYPCTGNLFPSSGNPSPGSGNLFPSSENLIPVMETWLNLHFQLKNDTYKT